MRVESIGSRLFMEGSQSSLLRNCTKEKIIRTALRIFAIVAELGSLLIGAHAITGSIALWHIFTAAILHVIAHRSWKKAETIRDLNDPNELAYLKRTFPELEMVEMLRQYSLDDIFRYDLVPLDTLRMRCASALRTPSSLSAHAEALLQWRIITPEIHRALIAQDKQELERILPKNRPDLEALFERAFGPNNRH